MSGAQTITRELTIAIRPTLDEAIPGHVDRAALALVAARGVVAYLSSPAFGARLVDALIERSARIHAQGLERETLSPIVARRHARELIEILLEQGGAR